ncbi:MAG: tetratricopeptide repeat protein [Candidatus Obscuribacterales bacterium]|nr:tetratricopeptide repeat protein [Candidatus Obscuribacterales bacterium]
MSGNRFSRLMGISLAALMAFSLITPQPVDAAKKRRARRTGTTSGGGGGGVVLSTPNPRNPLEHNNRGVELGSKGLWADAIREHEAALNGDPHNPDFRRNLSSAHLQYGSILMSKKKWYEAMHHFREALYADPNNLPAQNNLANCIKALGKDPDDYSVREHMADEAETSGNFPVAVVEWRICVKMRDDGMSRYRLGAAMYKQGKIVEGYEMLMSAVNKTWEKDQKNTLSQAHALMGDILWSVAQKAKSDGRGDVFLKRLHNVSVCYRRAVTVNPDNTAAVQGLITATKEAVAVSDSFENNLMLAGAYQLASDFEHAQLHYAKCWRINPSDARLHKARLSYHLAVVSSPVADPSMKNNTVMKVQALLEKRPDDPFLLYVFGKGKEELKDSDTALIAYKKAYLINPFVHPDLAQGLERLTGSNPSEGELDAKDGDAEVAGTGGNKGGTGGAAAAAAKAKPKPAIDPAVVSSIESKIAAGDLKGAEVDLMALIDKDPKLGKAWLMLGSVYEQEGELTQAKVAYRTAKVLKADGAEAAFNQINSSRVKPIIDRAKEAIANKEWVKAAASLREAIRLAPELPEAHRLLGDVLDQLGDKEEAKKERDKANELTNKK